MAKKGVNMATVDALIGRANSDMRALAAKGIRYTTVSCARCDITFAVRREAILVNADAAKRVRQWKPLRDENGNVSKDQNGEIVWLPARMAGHCRCGSRLRHPSEVFVTGGSEPVGLTASGAGRTWTAGAFNLDEDPPAHLNGPSEWMRNGGMPREGVGRRPSEPDHGTGAKGNVKIDRERWAHRDGRLERRRERMT